MTIISITATPETDVAYGNVFGLGDDQKVYRWEAGEWKPYDPRVQVEAVSL